MILFVTHTLSLTGSPKSMYNILLNLDINEKVIVISFEDGPLKSEYLALKNIELLVLDEKNFVLKNIKYLQFLFSHKPRLIFFNSFILGFQNLISKLFFYNTIAYNREFYEMLSKNKFIAILKLYLNFFSNKIIAVSQSNSIFLKMHGFNVDEVIYNICPTYKKKSYISNSNFFNIAFIGTFDHRKGFDRFIEIASYFKSNKKIVFHAFGDFVDTESILTRDKAIFKDLNIQFHGYVNNLDSYYHNFDLHLFLSRADSLPRTVMEATMNCVPTIGTNVGGTIELLPEGWEFCIDYDLKKMTKIINGFFANEYNYPLIKEQLGSKSKEFEKEYIINNILEIL